MVSELTISCGCVRDENNKSRAKDMALNGNSFAEWVNNNIDGGITQIWDYDKNELNPYEINKATPHLKVHLKCTETDYHGTYLIKPNDYIYGARCSMCHPYGSGKVHKLDSLGQYIIETYGVNSVDKYWSKNNNIDVFSVAKNSNKKYKFICNTNHMHGEYETVPNRFITGTLNGCSFCGNHSIYKDDSLGYKSPDSFTYWSDKNNTTPFDYHAYSKKEVWIKCDSGVHEDYKRSVSSSYVYEFRCPYCNKSKGERKIEEILNKYSIVNIQQKEFGGLVGVGGRNLSYDFYLEDFNILLEYQGEFHNGTKMESKTKFKKQIQHDEIKMQYCIDNNIDLLEIWYWEMDFIEAILIKELKLQPIIESE